MVEVVFAKVVFRQVRDVGRLHVWDVRRAKLSNVHCEPTVRIDREMESASAYCIS